jgi:hypothetical protein
VSSQSAPVGVLMLDAESWCAAPADLAPVERSGQVASVPIISDGSPLFPAVTEIPVDGVTTEPPCVAAGSAPISWPASS